MGVCGAKNLDMTADEAAAMDSMNDETALKDRGSSYANLVPHKKKKVEDDYETGGIELGEGTTGTVQIVVHRKTRRRCAMKTIDLDLLPPDPEIHRQLMGEIEVLNHMDHPNIVKLYESYEYNNNIYLIMELCTGGELLSKLSQQPNRRFSEHDACVLIRKLLSAVAYCHSKGVAHRDIKLANFVFKSDAPDAEPKLIDFGFSKMYYNTNMTTFVGTASYVAPEVLENAAEAAQGQYTEGIDMWGIGVITYMLLVGYPPFHAKTTDELMAKVKRGKYQMKTARWKTVTKQAKQFVGALLQPNIKKRLTAEQALTHAWVRQLEEKPIDPLLAQTIVANFRKFVAFPRLKRITLVVLAHTFDRNEIHDLEVVFSKIDTDKDGRLDLSEIVRLCLSVPEEGLTEAQVKTAFATIDQDNSGGIRFSEFLAVMVEDCCVKAENFDAHIARAFNLMDEDKSGYITPDDIKRALADAISDEAVAMIMAEADTNNDGKIDLDELGRVMRGNMWTPRRRLGRKKFTSEDDDTAASDGSTRSLGGATPEMIRLALKEENEHEGTVDALAVDGEAAPGVIKVVTSSSVSSPIAPSRTGSKAPAETVVNGTIPESKEGVPGPVPVALCSPPSMSSPLSGKVLATFSDADKKSNGGGEDASSSAAAATAAADDDGKKGGE